ncbi:CFI-box-CTERM domain-containing protein [Diaminobutyricimonas sp. LJ205]|uniref:CFI-box-CTERM domain-containing protein n=1 Tax=Diaminobutyricimonas sp. LJ205 TaxID=2683590 RepID=UPI0012F48EAC|nr:CFI-box-CTERM domain-containing protein [Diaminobutyricimonas sp. LJ205]
MADGSVQVEELKTLMREFVAELDTSTMPYIDEGLRGTVPLAQQSDADRNAGKLGFAIGSRFGGEPLAAFDAPRATELRLEGTALKRSGEYLVSAEKTVESFRLDGNYNLVNLRNLWKTALCGGDARGALDLIQKAISTYESYNTARRYEQLPYPPNDDLADVLEALRTEESCKSRLREFSGNPEYVLPRPYREIMADLYSDGSQRATTAAPAATQKSTGGCYIATAVYGSYDAPEVMVLRKFRDERLQRSAPGRGVIAAYYAVSPALAWRLPKHRRLSSQIRRVHDSVVDRLRSGSQLH